MTTILVIILLVAIEAFCMFGLIGQWARGRGPMRRGPRVDYEMVARLERELGVGP